MLVTILTVVFNNEKTIARTIESVLNQTYPDIEYIVIDGASSDNSASIARSYIHSFEETNGKSLKVISERDKGMYDGLNKGARLAKGEIVGQINSDDWYERDGIEKITNFFNQTHFDAAWGDVRIKRKDGDIIKKAKIGRIWSSRGWNHGASFSRREILLQNPYPLESMHDDFDYITRLHCEGKKLLVLNEVISDFTPGGMSTQKGFDEMEMRIKTTYGIYRKYDMSRLYLIDRVVTEIVKSFVMR